MRFPRLSRTRATSGPGLHVVATTSHATSDSQPHAPLGLLNDYTVEPRKVVPPPRRLDLARLGHDELISVALDCGFRPFAMSEEQLRAKLEALRQDHRRAA
jgi:hypothetical protein